MPLDIRKLHRAGALAHGGSVAWSWTVNGQEVGSIRINAATDCLNLIYWIVSQRVV